MMPLVWLTGVPGAGKTTVAAALVELGVDALDADADGFRAWQDRTTGEWVEDPGPGDRPSDWSERCWLPMVRSRVEDLRRAARGRVIVLAGHVPNEAECLDLFDSVVALAVDDETLSQRLIDRPGRSFGKTPEVRAGPSTAIRNRLYRRIARCLPRRRSRLTPYRVGVAATKENLLNLSDYTFQRTRARLDGLSDDEYFWAPAPDCWTIRRQADGRYLADWAVPLSGTGPFTTIAWRLWHLISCYGAQRNGAWLNVQVDDAAAEIPAVAVTSDAAFADGAAPPTAAAAIAALDAAHDFWRRCLTTVTEEGLKETLGPIAGQYAESDRAGFVLHMLDEFIHHGAEVALLRDLSRAEREAQELDPLVRALLAGDAGAAAAIEAKDATALDRVRYAHPDLVLEAASRGRWHAVPLLLDRGFAADVDQGAGALHHAAGAGRLDVVNLLVDHGANVERTDPSWRATPQGWAEYFRHQDVVAHLATKTSD